MTQVLYSSGNHRSVLLEEPPSSDAAVQANSHLVVHAGQGMILDPGGHKAYGQTLKETQGLLGQGELTHIFLSHQDPDVVAAINGWLMATGAVAYISRLWVRFIPHLGLDAQLVKRLVPIPDEGMALSLGGARLTVLPAHFLHSPGNFQVYDPLSRILYSGDLGASVGAPERVVTDFDRHVPFMEGFHRRYMASNRSMRRWAAMVRTLDIETIAPQHGAMLKGHATVRRFIEWCEHLECGVDLLDDLYRVPP